MEEAARTSPSAPPDAERQTTAVAAAASDPLPASRLRAPTPRVAVLIAALAIALVVIFAAGSAVRPFIVGLLLAYLLDPLVERFARLGIPRWLAVLLVYVVAIAVLAIGLAVALPPLVQQIGRFAEDLPTIIRQIQYQLDHLNEMYDRLGIPAELRTVADQLIRDAADAIQSFDLSVIRPIIDSAASFISSIFGYLILPAWLFFLLKDRPKLQVAFDHSLPPEWRRDAWGIAGIVHEVFGKWIRGQLLLGAVVGFASFVGLTVLGFTVDPIFGRFAVLLAIVAGLGELLPIIGPIITAVPAVLLGLTAGLVPALAALGLYFAIQQVENNILVPKIQSDAIDLHPSLVILALVLGGAIFGLLGAILALPVTAASRDIFKYAFQRAGESSGSGESGPGAGGFGDVETLEAAGARFAVTAGSESV